MQIRRSLLKWFDKVILLLALVFAMGMVSRMRPTREAQGLSEEAGKLIKEVRHSMRADPGLELAALDDGKRLRQAFAEPPDALPRAGNAWHPPGDRIHVFQVMSTQRITVALDHPLRGKVLVQDGGQWRPARPDEVSVSEDGKAFTIIGGPEGWFHARCEDRSAQHHLIAVHVTPFVPDPMVHRPGDVEAALVSGTKNVKVVWQAPEKQDTRAPIERYVVYRKKAAEGEFRKLGQVSGKQLSYEDVNTAFDTTYVYRVTTYSTKAKKPESTPSATVEIAIGRDFEFFLKVASPTVASVKVYKWHKAHWRHKTFPTKPGEEIGKVYKGHFRIDGKLQKLDIDFRTGCHLTAIDPRATVRRPGLPRPVLDQRIVYCDRDGSLKEKRRSEPDVAPWARFNQKPPVAEKDQRAQPNAPEPPGIKPPEVIE